MLDYDDSDRVQVQNSQSPRTNISSSSQLISSQLEPVSFSNPSAIDFTSILSQYNSYNSWQPDTTNFGFGRGTSTRKRNKQNGWNGLNQFENTKSQNKKHKKVKKFAKIFEDEEDRENVKDGDEN
jgi:hypothetical protein